MLHFSAKNGWLNGIRYILEGGYVSVKAANRVSQVYVTREFSSMPHLGFAVIWMNISLFNHTFLEALVSSLCTFIVKERVLITISALYYF